MIKRSHLQNKSLWLVLTVLFLGIYNVATKPASQTSTHSQESTSSSTPTPTSDTKNTESTTTPPTQTVSSIPAPNSTETHLVTRVVDGDTIVIDTGQTVRYIGIDTPETVHPDKPVMCFGPEASQKNKDLVLGKKVILEKDVSETDKYKRLLRYVWVDDVLINELLIKDGYATSSTFPPDVKHQDLFITAQKTAQQNKAGLWGKCQYFGETISSPTSSPSDPKSSGSCNIKGNISSSGEKIFHSPGCGSYSKTVIDTSTGEKYFCSESEALAAGWRKAKNCN